MIKWTGKMKTDKIRIHFNHAISGADWYTIINMYNNTSSKDLGGFLINKMEDVLYKEVEINFINKENEMLLYGIIYGYTRIEPMRFIHIDKYGYEIQ
jgi:tRNA(His) 5'-end guanylyltransferase